MSKIFISYRHDDSADVTGRLYDRLTQRFGRGSVVRDVDSIPLGVDFREFLTNAVSRCRVFLAVIGARWLDLRDDLGRRRLDDPDDFVRVEIEAALRREIPVIPVLVQGSHIPVREQLPESLKGLAYRNGMALRHDPDFAKDARRLIRSLKRVLGTGAERPELRGRRGRHLQCPFCLKRFTGILRPDGGMYRCPNCSASFRLPRPEEPVRVLYGHRDIVGAVTFSSCGRFAVTGSWDQTVRLWDLEMGREVRRFEGHYDRVLTVAVSPDSHKVMSAGADRTVCLWDAQIAQPLRLLVGNSGPKAGMTRWSAEKTMWAGAAAVHVCEHDEPILSVAFSPDGRRALSSEQHVVQLWEVETGKELRYFTGHEAHVLSVCFSPDGRFVLSAGQDRTLRLWDAEFGGEVRRFEGHTGWVRSAAFAPDGRHIVSGSHDGTVRLWECATGREVARLEGHTDIVRGVAYAPRGDRIVSCSDDRTVRLWDATRAEPILCYRGHSDRVTSVAFSPDGRLALSGGDDRSLCLWQVM
jgi:WD40 repeat protein